MTAWCKNITGVIFLYSIGMLHSEENYLSNFDTVVIPHLVDFKSDAKTLFPSYPGLNLVKLTGTVLLL